MFFFLIYSLNAFADSKCGNFEVHWADDGLARINGAKPETQKITFLKRDGDYNNVKFEWMVATEQPGVWIGMEFIGRNGKAILNAEWIRAGVTGVDQPRRLATYDCVRVK